MKKVVALMITVVLMGLFLTGCGIEYKKNTEKPSIVSTIFAAYDFSRTVAGDKCQTSMLLKPGAESHSYEPTPKDIIMIENCDVFIYTGGENDAWVDNLLTSIDNPDMKIIKMLDLVEKYHEEIVEGMESHEEEEEDAWDEHVWTNPLNAIIISESIAKILCEIDGSNSDYYMKNMELYKQELELLDSDLETLISNADCKELIFGDRFPLRYFIERYGLKYYAAFPGCAAESEPSAKTVAFLIDKTKNDGIKAVFKIELSNGNIAKTIAGDCGVKVFTFYTCHNLSLDDFNNGETYISFMRKNMEALREALY